MTAPTPAITSVTPNFFNSNVATPLNIAGIGLYPVKRVLIRWPGNAVSTDCTNVVAYGSGDRVTCLVPPMPPSVTISGTAQIQVVLDRGGNLLSGPQCSLENNSASGAGWTPGANTHVGTSSFTPPPPDGAYVLSLTALGANDILAVASGLGPITPGSLYYVSASFRALSTSRQCYVAVYWMDSGNNYISGPTLGGGSDSAFNWMTMSNMVTQAPAGAASAWFMPYVVGAAINEVHFVDLMVMVGVNDSTINAPLVNVTYVPVGTWTGPRPCVRKAWLTLGSTLINLEDPTQGYFCTQLDLGFPSVREVTNNKPDQDGTDDRTRFMGSR